MKPISSPSPALWRQLQGAASAVQAVLAGQSLTQTLDRVALQDRPGVQALSFVALRQLGRAMALRRLLAPRKPPVAVDALLCTVLALAGSEAGAHYAAHTLVNQAVEAARRQHDTRAHSHFINACLRRYLREQEMLVKTIEEDAQARWNHPVWWVHALQQDHPDHWQQILASAQEAAPMTLRINLKHGTPQDYLARLRSQGLDGRLVGQTGIQLAQPVPVQKLPGFAQGHASVQDAAAQLAAPLLLQGLQASSALRVLDACAAPGGKTGHLLECMPQARVLALDVDARRCLRIHDNLQRLGVHAEVRTADAAEPSTWWDGVLFDAILLDAPCTASGIGRRHPDVRWLRRPQDVTQLASVQASLLARLWPLLAPGGRLLYCTCSVFKAEGQSQIESFLVRNTDAQLLPSPGHLRPAPAPCSPSLMDNALGEHDGFFYALLAKRTP